MAFWFSWFIANSTQRSASKYSCFPLAGSDVSLSMFHLFYQLSFLFKSTFTIFLFLVYVIVYNLFEIHCCSHMYYVSGEICQTNCSRAKWMRPWIRGIEAILAKSRWVNCRNVHFSSSQSVFMFKLAVKWSCYVWGCRWMRSSQAFQFLFVSIDWLCTCKSWIHQMFRQHSG